MVAPSSSSASNSLNDAQKDSGEGEEKGSTTVGLPTMATTEEIKMRTLSFNQSTLTFSGETNPPSATYATVSSLPMSAHVAAAVDGNYCDNNEPLFINGSRLSLLGYPTGPASNRHWGIPQGVGLRGGAGETSVNNGAGSWSHPPTSGWGNAASNASNQGQQGQWGGGSSAAPNRSSAASQGPPGAPPPGSSGQQASNQQQPAVQQPQGAWDTQKNAQGNSGQTSGVTPPQGVWAQVSCILST